MLLSKKLNLEVRLLPLVHITSLSFFILGFCINSSMARTSVFKRESTRSLKAGEIKQHVKTDPIIAADAAFYEKATIEPLRSVEHKDRDGNVIGKPSSLP